MSMSAQALRTATAGRLITRRRWLIGSGAAVLAAFGAAGWLVRDLTADSGAADSSSVPLAPHLIAFMGALFGRELTDQDRQELAQRLADSFAESATLASGCRQLVGELDRTARLVGADSFLTASAGQRQLVVDRLMMNRKPSLLSRAWSRLSSEHREYVRTQALTIAQLAWLYRHSGAAWRARGYARWPGVPGNWREVLQAGGAYP